MTDKTEGLEVVAEVSCEDMGKPFNAMQIRVHFTKEVPPVGTQLVALASAQAAVAAREQYHDAYVEGVLESYAEFHQRITQLEAALVVARNVCSLALSAIQEQHYSASTPIAMQLYRQAVTELPRMLAAIDSVGLTK